MNKEVEKPPTAEAPSFIRFLLLAPTGALIVICDIVYPFSNFSIDAIDVTSVTLSCKLDTNSTEQEGDRGRLENSFYC